MIHNEVIDTLLAHKSIRKYKSEMPSDEMLETVIKTGQQAPFASQAYSILLSRDTRKNQFNAPWLFYFCVDIHKFELIMKKRGWKRIMNDFFVLLLSIEDVSYVAQNMVIAGRSLGLGSCFLGYAPYHAKTIKKQFELPEHIFPVVGLTMGFSDEEPEKRPRYPLDFVLFEDKYPKLDDKIIDRAMQIMDDGYLKQDYYKRLNAKINLGKEIEDKYSYDDYSWTEHISRKWGLWSEDPEELFKQFKLCGFDIRGEKNNKEL